MCGHTAQDTLAHGVGTFGEEMDPQKSRIGKFRECLAGFVRKKGDGDVGERLSLGSVSSLLCERASSHSRRPNPPFLGLGLASLPVTAKHQWECGSVGQEAKRHSEISWGSLLLRSISSTGQVAEFLSHLPPTHFQIIP